MAKYVEKFLGTFPSGASSPGSYDDTSSVSSVTVGDYDEDVIKELSDDGYDNITPTSRTPPLDASAQVVLPDNDLQEHFDYWTMALEDAPVLLDLPTDSPRAPNRLSAADQIPIRLGSPLTQSLKRLATEHGVDLSMALMAGWSAVLSRLSRQEDIVIGVHTSDLGYTNHPNNNKNSVNNVPIRLDLSGDPSTTQLLERVGRAAASAKAHQEFSLEQIIDIVKPAKGDQSMPLFQVVFQWREQEHSATAQSFSRSINVDLELHLEDSGDEIVGVLWFASTLFNADTIVRHAGYIEAILGCMIQDTTRPIDTFDIISSIERGLLAERWINASAQYPDHLCMHQLFESQVERTPNAIAAVYENERLTYDELNTRANGLAHRLIELGVQPDTRVAICVERSLAMLTGVLAILKAGGAYVPLDPTYTSDRLRNILADAEPKIALVDKSGRIALGETALASLTALDPSTPIDHSKSNPQVAGLNSRRLAYIIYTSGSTGKPKGVMIEHRGVVNLVQAHTKFFGIRHDSRFLQFASINFDASVADIMLPLSSGATMYIPLDSVRLDRNGLWDYISRHSITHAALTPSFLQDGKKLQVLKTPPTLVLGGEPLGRTLLRNLISQGYHVINDYGPTETTISAISWRCPASFNAEVLPIGRPLDNVRVYLLDKHLHPVPLGAVGEMYIGGAGVARGYLNRPDLTAERFLPDPFAENAEARMYRTGDLARYTSDGHLVFQGRNDFQIKIRGFRVELGEIEARLVDHPLVQEAAVVAIGEESDKRLVGYVVARPTEQLVQILRSHLASCLPNYMIPTAIVRLDAFPLTPSDKLDRKALPAPDEESFARETYEMPQGETERILAAIWQELLGIGAIGRQDNFFALGGHSLLVVRMLDRLRRHGLTAPIRTIYESPVLKELAQALSGHQAEIIPPNLITAQTTELKPEMLPLIDLTQTDIDHIIHQTPGGLENIQDVYALSPLQDGILFHHLLTTEGDPYLQSSQMIFEDRELLDRYLCAFQKVVDRHDILRTAFTWKDTSTPVQVVWRHAPLIVQELALDSADGPILKQLEQRFHPNHYRINLSQAPLVHIVAAEDCDGRWLITQLVHHLIGDHAAAEMMNLEIERILHGQEHTLTVPQPFRNMVAKMRSGSDNDAHERFFKEMLGDIVEPTFPFGLAEVHLSGADASESHQMLPKDLNDRLRSQAKQIGVSLASLCHVAWAQVLARTSGQESVVFGTVLFGGMQDEQSTDNVMGIAINTLPFRCDIDGSSIRKCVHEAHKRLAALMEHEHSSLAKAQRCSGVPAGTPLFSAILNYLHTALPSSESSARPEIEFVSQEEQIHYPGIELVGGRERTNYPFAMIVEDFDTAMGMTAHVLQPFDPARVCGYMRQALESLVMALEGTCEVPAMGLEVLPPEERTLLLQKWNSFEMDYPSYQTTHGLFEEQVEQVPETIAVVYEDQELSYSELNTRANRLAHHLIGLGVTPDTRVAICVERSLAMVIGTIAILKAGGAYVPLDPAYASERLRDTLIDAAPHIVVADETGRMALGDKALASVTVVDPNAPVYDTERSSNPKVMELTSHHLAYVIYTSGSTGKPKGVMVEHQGVVNAVKTRPSVFKLGAGCRFIQFFSFGFDACAMIMFSALGYGGTLHLLSDRVRYDQGRLWDYLEQQQITHALLTPTVLQNYESLRTLNTTLTLVLAGEALPATLIRGLQSLIPNGRIVNDYGPTETAVSAIAWDCPTDFNAEIVPIGRPIANKRVYLLDKHRKPVPLGAVGELFIGGVGVARGYLNRPELTAEAFIPDSFSDLPDAKMYKTGDLARYLPDGNMVFMGRNDHQVKIRGYRVELGEIESRICDNPLVQKAVVLAMGEGADKKLVAYVVAQPGNKLVHALRSHLSSRLPVYMVPAAIVCLDSLPLTTNGKLDSKALPAPGSDAFDRQAYEAPRGDVECAIAQIWAELLHLDRVGRNDNFFALGGHSLLVVQLTERLRRKGLAAPISALFKTPTLTVFAQSIRQQHHTQTAPSNQITLNTVSITPSMLPLVDLSQEEIDRVVSHVPGGVANTQDIYPLSPLQEGILFHHLLSTKGDPYLLVTCMAFASRELLDRYLDAIQQVVNRHDILRTGFVWNNLSKPVQVVWRRAPLSVKEYQLDPSKGPIKDQLMQQLDPRHHRIDLSQAPLLQYGVAQDNGRWLLVQLLHHLIGDHSTLESMEFETKAFLEDRGDALPVPQPFRNLIAHSQSQLNEDEHTKFFTEMLGDIDTPTLPFGLTDVYGQGEGVTTSYQTLPQDLNERLRTQARHLGVSVASLCHLAWAQVISRTCGEDQVVFGTVLFGRMQSGPGTDTAMGLFINTLPLRVDLDCDVRKCVAQTHARLAALLEHEHASLALAQRCSSVSKGTPLFSTMLNYRHNLRSWDDVTVIPGIELLEEHERTNYPFIMSVEDYGTALGLTADVVRPYDSSRVCGYMQQALHSLVEALEQTQDFSANHLDVLPMEEHEMLLHTWNATQQYYPANDCIHHLFEQQVERSPQATALVFMDESMTYLDLNIRANRLAHQLIELGVRPDMRVAICVERSLAMIIGVLAILKAGGAYVPLDPTYPRERLVSILEDAEPALLLADATGRATLSGVRLHNPSQRDHADPTSIITIDPNEHFESSIMNPRIPGLTSQHLAYVMYTSGSTGRPKGVMLEHQGVVNLAYSRPTDFGVDASSRVLQFTSLSFDLSVSEILMAFYSGASLYLLQDRIRTDRVQLWDYLARHSITHMTVTPSLLRDSADLSPLETPLTFIMGGEALPTDLLRTLGTLAPNGRVINDYGPTEATIAATALTCMDNVKGEIVSIGRPLANKRIYILDKRGHPGPLGAIGELYIGGAGIARGYLNRPELTAQVFVADPFAGSPDARMYKTGDLARYDHDGNIIFLGRNDHQVKIRGFRIELGEIEARLAEHPLVQKSVVVAMGEGNDKRLVGYVVAQPDDQLVSILRLHLASCLPNYMIPAAIVRLDKFPLTPNEKLDRKALPVPGGDAYVRQGYEAPEGEIEMAIASIWAELLQLDRVSRNDNFFGLGGHSLLAVRLMNRVATLGVQLPLSTLFASPSLSSFAELVERHLGTGEDTLPEIEPVSRDGDLELSFSQQRSWFLTQLDGVSETYHMPVAVRLQGQLDHDAWQRALDTLFARHEALRTVFVTVHSQPRVQLLPAESGIPIRWVDLQGVSDSEAQLKEMSTEEIVRPFDFVHGPLVRAFMARLDNDEYFFLLTKHHIISDGWSLVVLQSELSTLYDAYSRGESNPLLPLAVQYPDYASWQRNWLTGDRHEALSSYWRSTLADAPVLLNLPTDRPRPSRQSFTGDRVQIRFDKQFTHSLKQLSQKYGATLFMTIMTAWSVVLSQLSNQDDIIIGSLTANRNHHQIEPLIGFFVNTLALRVDLSGDLTVGQLLERVRDSAVGAQTHQDLPFEQVVDIVQPMRSLAHSPLFQVMFIWQSNETPTWHLPGIDAAEAPVNYNVISFDLELQLHEVDGEIVGALGYSTALFDRSTIERQVGYLETVLQAMVADLDRGIKTVELLAPAERNLLPQVQNTVQQVPYEAPQGKIESALEALWMDLLHVDTIGRHDNFFMLGGHSLLATRVVSQIRSILGFEVSLGELFEAPTIAQLAPRLLSTRNNQENAFNVLLPIKPQGTRRPLFCIHPAFGISWSFIGLTKHLNVEQPVYGLQARGFHNGEQPATTLAEMALDYISQIQEIQAHGPYRLLGYSFGGKVAHAMAAHLEKLGERVDMLAIMDTIPNDNPLMSNGQSPETNNLLLGYNVDETPELMRIFLERASYVKSWNDSLSRSHSPPTFGGNMVLFRAIEQNESISCATAWKPYVLGEIEEFDISCNHDDMDKPVALAEIGGTLAWKLDELHMHETKED
ncbi:hypothetical protein BGX31_001789 [Mortierella sp. GBA43]|nr:hypothetical protein BGX31_001789 [Mortierella sp. GBA43]